MKTGFVSRTKQLTAKLPLVAWLVTCKVVYLVAILSTLLAWNDLSEEKFMAIEARWPRSGGPVFASHFASWKPSRKPKTTSLSFCREFELGRHEGSQ